MNLSKWDARFFNLALEVAKWSKDPNKQVGAVIISPDKREISYGYNGFPQKLADDARLESKDTKNALSLHAEVNAVLNAKKSLSGWSLYCSEPICEQCALVIIQAGITNVAMPAPHPDSSWAHSCRRARNLFCEANVEVNLINVSHPYV